MKRHLGSFLITSLVPLGFWLGGFNFDERGGVALFCYAISLMVYIITVTFPGWKD